MICKSLEIVTPAKAGVRVSCESRAILKTGFLLSQE